MKIYRDFKDEATAKEFAEQVGETVSTVTSRGEVVAYRVYYYTD